MNQSNQINHNTRSHQARQAYQGHPINAQAIQRMQPMLANNQTERLPPKYHGANNVYYKEGCPALMDDGHFITYYNSTNELTNQMQKLNGIRSANQFRTFMQNHGLEIMNSEREYYMREYLCAPKIACSQGFYDLWMIDQGNWGNLSD